MAEQGQVPQNDPQDLVNTLFPPPPPFYQHFSTENLTRYATLAGPSGTSKNRALPSVDHELYEGERDIQDEEEFQNLRAMLEPPRADWVVEEGRWKCFGEVYTTDLAIRSATDIGLPPWVDPDEPPQKSLPPILHSFLNTLLLLIDALTQSAMNPMELAQRQIHHVGDPYIQHLSNLAATMMVSSNQLRGIQAEATLVMLMEKQVETRKAQTAALREKCRNIASNIQKLKQAAQASLGEGKEKMDVDSRSVAGDPVG